MFNFLSKVGYTQVNPLVMRKVTYSRNPEAIRVRALGKFTWYFIRDQLTIPDEELLSPTTAKNLSVKSKHEIRKAAQRRIIFYALYLTGCRIHELAAIKMSDFAIKYLPNGEKVYVLHILGKGKKDRTFNVNNELIVEIERYRNILNLCPAETRLKSDRVTVLNTKPLTQDESPLIFRVSGKKGLSTNGVSKIFKEKMGDILMHFDTFDDVEHASVDRDQLVNASVHWMRHTTATHLSLQGVPTEAIQHQLGHASADTTAIYVTNPLATRVKQTENFTAGNFDG
jgi:site-specific recombinase XerD